MAHVIFFHHENDHKIVAHAKRTMKEILQAAGGEDVWTADRTAHLLGTLVNLHTTNELNA